jgi:hypothetical protein
MVDILGPRLVAVRCKTISLLDRSLHSLLDSMDLISNRALPGLTTQWSDFRQRSGPKSASHSYYTPKLALVKSYDAFFCFFSLSVSFIYDPFFVLLSKCGLAAFH